MKANESSLTGEVSYGRMIHPLSTISGLACDRIVVTSYLKKNDICREMLNGQVKTEQSLMAFGDAA